jgi:hypothetical protein
MNTSPTIIRDFLNFVWKNISVSNISPRRDATRQPRGPYNPML